MLAGSGLKEKSWEWGRVLDWKSLFHAIFHCHQWSLSYLCLHATGNGEPRVGFTGPSLSLCHVLGGSLPSDSLLIFQGHDMFSKKLFISKEGFVSWLLFFFFFFAKQALPIACSFWSVQSRTTWNIILWPIHRRAVVLSLGEFWPRWHLATSRDISDSFNACACACSWRLVGGGQGWHQIAHNDQNSPHDKGSSSPYCQ